MIKTRIASILLALVLAACAYSFTGTAEIGNTILVAQSDSGSTVPTDSIPADSTDENMDDEFDLLYD